MTGPKDYYRSETQMEAVVRGFENCTLPASEFNHAAHLTVALSYLHQAQLTVPEAATRMREAIYRFLDHYGQGRQIYNETITLFWIKLVRSFLDQTDEARPLKEIANEMIESLGSSHLIYDYYSKERLSSDESRKAWVEPDVKSKDEG
jgi:hypothetical protein